MIIHLLKRAAAAAACILAVATSSGAQTPAPDCSASAAPATQTFPVTIPIELHGNHVAFWVCRAGKPVMFVLDTGAGQSIIDLTLAKSLGVTLTSPFRATGAGAGSIEAAQVRGESVTLAGTSITAPLTFAMDLASVAGPEGASMQGILGADFISRYVVALDYHHMQMRLYESDRLVYDGPGTFIPFTLVNGFIRVSADVTLADGARLRGSFVVDVGSALSLALAKPFVEQNHLRDRVGPTVHRPSGRGVGGPAMADVARVPSLNIGGVEIKNPVAFLYGDSAGVFSSGNAGDGNIGGDILKRFVTYFDYKGRTMILEPNEVTNEPFEADMSGLQLAVNRDGSGFTVEFVVEKSPAGELAMKKGDLVVAIDGKPADAAHLDELRVRMRRVGEHISFTVKRGATPIVFQLVTRRLV